MQWNNLSKTLLCASPPQSKALAHDFQNSNKSKTSINRHTSSSNNFKNAKHYLQSPLLPSSSHINNNNMNNNNDNKNNNDVIDKQLNNSISALFIQEMKSEENRSKCLEDLCTVMK